MVSKDVAVASLHRALENPKNQDNQKDPELVLPKEFNKPQQRSHEKPIDGNQKRNDDCEDKPSFCKPF